MCRRLMLISKKVILLHDVKYLSEMIVVTHSILSFQIQYPLHLKKKQ